MATVEDLEENKTKTRVMQKSSFMIEDILSRQKALSSMIRVKKNIINIIVAISEQANQALTSQLAQQSIQQNIATLNMLSRQPRVSLLSPSLHSLNPGKIKFIGK